MRFFAQEGKLSNVKFSGPVSLHRQIVYQRKLTWFRGEAMSVFSVMYITVVSRLQAPWWHGRHLRTVAQSGRLTRPPGAGLILQHMSGCISVFGFIPPVQTHISYG